MIASPCVTKNALAVTQKTNALNKEREQNMLDIVCAGIGIEAWHDKGSQPTLQFLCLACSCWRQANRSSPTRIGGSKSGLL
jgi:hypothetical protein